MKMQNQWVSFSTRKNLSDIKVALSCLTRVSETYHKETFPYLEPFTQHLRAFRNNWIFFRHVFEVNVGLWKDASLTSFSAATSTEPCARFFKYLDHVTHVDGESMLNPPIPVVNCCFVKRVREKMSRTTKNVLSKLEWVTRGMLLRNKKNLFKVHRVICFSEHDMIFKCSIVYTPQTVLLAKFGSRNSFGFWSELIIISPPVHHCSTDHENYMLILFRIFRISD